ncbi:hypothetical protein OUZ56_029806 [Daphnia magna]|uniref:Uncharacterized protein n=1 Tax=Daphnia magna TaxID=35525 RepID=A0ABR0B7X1_9CRUS|nr:hypothetical protein OUZ56_029806 [Daphnia magna]
MEMEQLNILNDLVGRINEGEGKELPDIIVTEEQDNQIGNIIFIACNPIPRIKESFRRRKQSRNVSESDGQEMDSMIPEPIYSAGGANQKPFIREFAPLMTSATETPKETLTSINTPSAAKKGKLYPIGELKWENEQNKECTGSHMTCSYVVGYGMNQPNDSKQPIGLDGAQVVSGYRNTSAPDIYWKPKPKDDKYHPRILPTTRTVRAAVEEYREVGRSQDIVTLGGDV